MEYIYVYTSEAPGVPDFDCTYLLRPNHLVFWNRPSCDDHGRSTGDVALVILVRFHPPKLCGCMRHGCKYCRHSRNHYDVCLLIDGDIEWHEAFFWDLLAPEAQITTTRENN
jgi:hypothetical protein